METKHPAIFASLAAIAKIIAAEGVAKAKQSEQAGKFWYRGIDDVTGVMSTPFAANHVLVVPSYQLLETDVRATNSGGSFFVARVLGTFVLTSTVDGSSVTVGPVPGEAGDSGDKAMSKACSVSLRNAMLQTFLAPIGPEMDPETGVEPRAVERAEKPKAQARSNKAKAAEKAGGEPGIHGLSESQLNVLARKRDMANLTDETMLKKWPSIGPHNINAVLSGLKDLAEAAE